jgi:predicted TPR repeat methyltransferase
MSSAIEALIQAGNLVEARQQLGLLPLGPEHDYYAAVIDSEAGLLRPAEHRLKHLLKQLPGMVPASVQLASVLLRQGRAQDAERIFADVIQRVPGHGGAHLGMAQALADQQRNQEAEALLQSMLQTWPAQSEIYAEGVRIALKLGDKAAAVAWHGQRKAACPPHRLHDMDAIRLAIEDKQEALAERWLADYLHQFPGDSVAQHLLDSIQGQTRARASADYVRQVFDAYAEQYDQHLEGALQSVVPKQIAELLRASVPAGSIGADLGCGTGLLAQHLGSGYRLIGVDLSGAMLEKSKARGYQSLIEADIEQYLQTVASASLDFVVASDTMIYLGDLAVFSKALRQALKPGGHFIASFEALTEAQAFKLMPHARFAHHQNYLRNCFDSAGLSLKSLTSMVLRRERGAEVAGLLLHCLRA